MSASGPVAICNRALTAVGANTITSFLDGTTEAKVCNVHYESLRDTVLAAYHWTFATKRFGPMTPDVTPPVYGYSRAYTLPADLLTLIAVNLGGTSTEGRREVSDYAVEGGKLVTNFGENVHIKYVARVTDTTRFTQPFTEALIARMAAEFAQPLAESRTLAESMFTLYERKIDEASSVDNQQGRNIQTFPTRALRARWSTGGRPGFYQYGR